MYRWKGTKLLSLTTKADLEKGLQLSKVEVWVERRGLVPDGTLLRRFDLVPMQLLQLASLACSRSHLLAWHSTIQIQIQFKIQSQINIQTHAFGLVFTTGHPPWCGSSCSYDVM